MIEILFNWDSKQKCQSGDFIELWWFMSLWAFNGKRYLLRLHAPQTVIEKASLLDALAAGTFTLTWTPLDTNHPPKNPRSPSTSPMAAAHPNDIGPFDGTRLAKLLAKHDKELKASTRPQNSPDPNLTEDPGVVPIHGRQLGRLLRRGFTLSGTMLGWVLWVRLQGFPLEHCIGAMISDCWFDLSVVLLTDRCMCL